MARFLPGGGSPGRGSLSGAVTYSRWRMQTAYGDSAAKPVVGDFLEYLDWLRELRVITSPGMR
ncbi:MAG: hypothetical protein DCC49_10010 [Acidobacteria bacterium]|nr:MAG: hypothetical protein DCC49_10010 [Acidobacteriota bacterium]